MRKTFVLTAVFCLFGAAVASADTATGTLAISATILNTCSVAGGTLNFGSSLTYSSTLPQTDGSGTFSVTCTLAAAYSIDLDNGLNASGSQRRIKHSTADFINYDLYQDSGRTTPWGSGLNGKLLQVGTGSAQSNTAFGRIPSGQTPPAGPYSDTVTITVNFTP
ncbi:MAG TPA: spore coat U domain-containing protein [Thermoanaerobaculia bacterium]|nr:spore coat U domain-containing protein [Thermoanaerobaculia bacterium]